MEYIQNIIAQDIVKELPNVEFRPATSYWDTACIISNYRVLVTFYPHQIAFTYSARSLPPYTEFLVQINLADPAFDPEILKEWVCRVFALGRAKKHAEAVKTIHDCPFL